MNDAEITWARTAVRFWLRRWIEQCAADFDAESRRLARAAESVRGWIA